MIRRKGFQLHLSTLLTLIVVAGGLIGLNVTPQAPDQNGLSRSGWPIPYRHWRDDNTVRLEYTEWPFLFLNIVVAGGVLAGAWAIVDLYRD